MLDVMIDLETLGNSAGCVVLSIGAVAFDPETGEMGEEFYSVIGVASSVCAGLRFDQDTLDWWGKQSPEARQVLKEAYAPGALDLVSVCHDFARYLNRATGGKSPRIWGNGAGFDQPILVTAYRAARVKLPWDFWNDRCYRTLKNQNPQVALPARTGTHHNALDDAKTQAVHALQIFAALRKVQSAVANLRAVQRQLDADGCAVGVSRQALDEVLATFPETAAWAKDARDDLANTMVDDLIG